MDNLDEFIEWLKYQTNRKKKLYDGLNSKRSLHEFLAFSVEELGELSSDITRERYFQAEAECIDLAHTAFLIFNKLREDKLIQFHE